jgi:hypothetical protein
MNPIIVKRLPGNGPFSFKKNSLVKGIVPKLVRGYNQPEEFTA